MLICSPRTPTIFNQSLPIKAYLKKSDFEIFVPSASICTCLDALTFIPICI